MILLVIGVDLTVESTVKSVLELTSELSLWPEKIVVEWGDRLIKKQITKRS